MGTRQWQGLNLAVLHAKLSPTVILAGSQVSSEASGLCLLG